MKVIALKICDARLPGGRKALFPGQGYDIPKAEAERLAKRGLVSLKAVHGPPEDKALEHPITKGSIEGGRRRSPEDKEPLPAEPPPAEPEKSI